MVVPNRLRLAAERAMTPFYILAALAYALFWIAYLGLRNVLFREPIMAISEEQARREGIYLGQIECVVKDEEGRKRNDDKSP